MPVCNADAFQIFLNELSKQRPLELKILVLDNGAFHKAIKLSIPDHIVLIFLPPYSPELNPAEKVWAKFNRDLTNRLFVSLDALEIYLSQTAIDLHAKEVLSICSYSYIISIPFWTMI